MTFLARVKILEWKVKNITIDTEKQKNNLQMMEKKRYMEERNTKIT